VVTTWGAVPRFAWSIFDRGPWLLVDPADIGDVREALARTGSERFVFVTADPKVDRPKLAGLDVVWAARDADGRADILVLERPATPR
jgi:hypothetical protein